MVLMPETFSEAYLEEVRREFQRLKQLAEAAVAQVEPQDFFTTLDPESNSLAVQMKHLGGSLRSRWTDFLTTDGEKPDRDRDHEFLVEGDTRESIVALWQLGWERLDGTLNGLTAGDLLTTVFIRGEPHSVVGAITRSSSHAAYHVGQIVQLARHLAGDRWRSLSIPRGQSEAFNKRMRERAAKRQGG